jgi:hypothetical protein
LVGQNTKNRIEISKLGLGVMSDAPTESRNDPRRRRAKREVRSLKQAINDNVAKKVELKKELQLSEQSLRPHEAKLEALMGEVAGQTKELALKGGGSLPKRFQARLASAEGQISSLELANLELEQAAMIHEGMVRERDLALAKVQLQVQLRDRALAMVVNALRRQTDVDVDEMLRLLARGPVESILKDLMAGGAGVAGKASDGDRRTESNGTGGPRASGSAAAAPVPRHAELPRDGDGDEDEEANEDDEEGDFAGVDSGARPPSGGQGGEAGRGQRGRVRERVFRGRGRGRRG